VSRRWVAGVNAAPRGNIALMDDTAFELIGPEESSQSRLIFVCDHASNVLPASYGDLGLKRDMFDTHIAFDIGAAEVTRTLAKAYRAPAILARWSRLLIDLNRGADDPTIIMKLSDGSIIPGNRNADATEVAKRIAQFHAPYHDAIEVEVAQARTRGIVPVLVSMHSFTPTMKGRKRPWEIGILWDRDDRLARPLLEHFARAGFVVGDNEPYSGELENDCMYRHGTMQGLPHVLIEMRQDLIATEDAARAFAMRFKPVLDAALGDMEQPAIRFTRPLAKANGDVTMDEQTREKLEAAAFRRLVALLRERTDVQNIDLMIHGGFCRNCLGDWYRDAAEERGIKLSKDEAREIVYGMPQSEWKKRHQKEATPEQQAAFEASQKTHS
jgi:predicted N-formylglutamate amidohydrolase